MRALNYFSWHFLVLATLFFSFDVAADEEAKAILLTAAKNTSRSSFKAINPVVNGKETHITFHHSYAPNGDFLERYERSFPGMNPRFMLKNQDGDFIGFLNPEGGILGDTVIKINSTQLDISLPLRFFTYYNSFDIGSYSCEPTTYKQIPCYRITVDYPEDDASIAKIFNASMERFEEYKDHYKSRYCAKMVFTVKQESPFILACEHYNLSGQQLMSLDWGEPEFMELSPDFFAVPEHVTVRFSETEEDAKKIAREIHKDQIPSSATLSVAKSKTGIVIIISITVALMGALTGALVVSKAKKKTPKHTS